ncbi:MAG: TonB family protein [Chitinophagaceae bacterium]|nr:TonB family protein [Chitinophagaceae bacterium]
MTNSEIIQASLLDIIFENRNKEYGAYALRKGYNARLLTALGAAMSVIFLFVVTSLLNSKKATVVPVKKYREELVIRAIVMPKEKSVEPDKPKEAVKTKPVKRVAEIKYTNVINIKKDNLVKEIMPPVDNLNGKLTSTQNVTGVPDDHLVKEMAKPAENGNGSGPSQPNEAEFKIQEKDPEFPGGAEAMKKFLARYLNTPEQLEDGEKKLVKIRFKVDKDGTVNTFEIVTSGGDLFDSEVVRVCKKMPRWTPAIQNGINVPVSYVLPITFIGVIE